MPWNTEPASGRAIPPVHRSHRIFRSSMRRIAGVVTTLIATLAIGVAPAYATTSGGIALYISGPLVQGSELTGISLTENFNSPSPADFPGAVCPNTIAVGTLLPNPRTLNNCRLQTPGIYGGAESEGSSPSFGGAGSGFINVTEDLTVVFPGAVKYVGFWWSGGNRGNKVEFYNGASKIAELDTLALEELLGSVPPSPFPGAGTVTSFGGDSYPKGHYFGNPRGFSSYPPTAPSVALRESPTVATTYTQHQDYLYVYLNLFLTGEQAATSVKFLGPGFELDNLTTSTLEQTPASSLVFVRGLLGKTVQFLPGANDSTGSMVAQSSTTAANLSANRYQRTGYTFTGWNTAENGTGTPYGAGANYNFAADMTLYAQWAPAPSSGGGGSSGTPAASTAPQLAATGIDPSLGLLSVVGIISLGVGAIVAAAGLTRRRGRSV